MGYDTKYVLKIIENKSKFTPQHILYEFEHYNDEILWMVSNENMAKWYEYDYDMKRFSKLYPEVLFKLSGEGEESGDIWINYYKDGKCQRCKGIVTFDKYDESKLI